MDRKLLEKLVADGKSTREISETTGKAQTPVRYWLKKYGLKTVYEDPRKRRRWTNEQMIEAIKTSDSFADALRKVGLTVRPGNYDVMYRFVSKHQLDTSHIERHRYKGGGRKPIDLSTVLVEESPCTNRTALKKRLLSEGLIENECSECGQDGEWKGNPLRMVLDHINGVNNDWRIGNLRMLCPNCNSQQKTFCRGQKGHGSSGGRAPH